VTTTVKLVVSQQLVETKELDVLISKQENQLILFASVATMEVMNAVSMLEPAD
jgi:hypothetical protein